MSILKNLIQDAKDIAEDPHASLPYKEQPYIRESEETKQLVSKCLVNWWFQWNWWNGTRRIRARIKWGEKFIQLSDISFFKSDTKYNEYYDQDWKMISETGESLKNLLLDIWDIFIRVHRNCIINKSNLDGFQRKTYPNDTGTTITKMHPIINWKPNTDIEISRRYIAKVKVFLREGE